MTETKRYKISFSLTLLLLLFCACSKEENPEELLADLSSTIEKDKTDETTPVPQTSKLTLTIDSKLGLDARLYNEEGITIPCSADTEGTDASEKEINCTLDMKELELKQRGFGVDLTFPLETEKCAYVAFEPYFFFRDQAGFGPTNVTIRKEADGDVAFKGTAPDNVSLQGELPVCAFDYSKTDSTLPNCCQGKYRLTTETEDPDNPGSFPNPVTTEQDWGGKIGNCIGGAGMDSTLDENGIPFTLIFRLLKETEQSSEGSSLFIQNQTKMHNALVMDWGVPHPQFLFLDIPSSFEDFLSKPEQFSPMAAPTVGTKKLQYRVEGVLGKFRSNLYAANHLDGATITTPFARPSTIPDGVSATPNFAYGFRCLDRAFDTHAVINLFVREWNDKDQFASGESGEANPGLNQVRDWFDIGNVFPKEKF